MLKYLYIFSLTYAFIDKFGFIRFPYFAKYGIAAFWILYAISISKNNRSVIVKIANVYARPIYLCLFATLLFWCVSLPLDWSFHYFTRFSSNVFVSIITVFSSISATCIFKKETLDYTFYALCLSVLLCCLNCVLTFGLGPFVYVCIHMIEYVNFEFYGTYNCVGYFLEVHDATFAFGLFFLYFLLFEGYHDKRRKMKLCMCLIGMWLGLKRIEIGAIIMCLFFYYVYVKRVWLSPKNQVQIVFFLILSASIIYVALMKYMPELFYFLDAARVDLYSFLGNMASFNPFDLGQGFGYINEFLEKNGVKLDYGEYRQGLLSVSHSDLVRLFIELGLPCFIAWLYMLCISIPMFVYKVGKAKSYYTYMILLAFMLVTYLIDNTMLLFATQYSFYLITAFTIVPNIKTKMI